MYRSGFCLYLSSSCICRLTLSLRLDESTLISSRVISRDPCCEVTPTKSCTSGRLFFRCRPPPDVGD